MRSLETYLEHLKERKQKLIAKRLPVVDADCEVQKIIRRSHNAKLKFKIDSLNTCILSVESYKKEND